MNVQNFPLKQIPERTASPREYGLTMINDKGLSVDEAKNLLSIASPYIDIVKLAFGASFVSQDLAEKIKIFQEAGVKVYFGGLLFEAFVVRNQFPDFVDLLGKFAIDY